MGLQDIDGVIVGVPDEESTDSISPPATLPLNRSVSAHPKLETIGGDGTDLREQMKSKSSMFMRNVSVTNFMKRDTSFFKKSLKGSGDTKSPGRSFTSTRTSESSEVQVLLADGTFISTIITLTTRSEELSRTLAHHLQLNTEVSLSFAIYVCISQAGGILRYKKPSQYQHIEQVRRP
jgi:hypothetical protein